MALGSDCWYLLLRCGLVDTHWLPLEFVVLAKATLPLSFFNLFWMGSPSGYLLITLLCLVRAVLLGRCAYHCCCSTLTVHCSWCWHCPRNGSRLLFSLLHSIRSRQTVLAVHSLLLHSLYCLYCSFGCFLQWVASLLFFHGHRSCSTMGIH
jgi:hypothetical protein